MYLDLLKRYKEQYGFKLFSFCLMPNHLHLLLELKEGLTISDIMHDLNSNYTKYFNGKYQRKGHLFQERYKMNLVEKTPYLLYILTTYLHLNPKALGLVSEIKDYPYSSYSLYEAGEGSRFLVLRGLNLDEEIKEVLLALRQRQAAGSEHQAYADYLVEISKEEMEMLAKDLLKKPILGSEGFVKRVEDERLKSERLKVKGKGVNKRFIAIGSALILILGILTIYLYTETSGLKTHFSKEIKKKEGQLDEKYKAELDAYYKELAGKLQLEKQKTKGLEEKLMKEQR
jgi:hypothetical protein